MIEQYPTPMTFYQQAHRTSDKRFSRSRFNLLKQEVLMCTVLDLSCTDDNSVEFVINPTKKKELPKTTRQQIVDKWDSFASTSKHAALTRTYNELYSKHESLVISVRQLKQTPNFTVIIKIRSWASNERAVECVNDIVKRATVVYLHVTKYKTAKTGIKELFINLSTPSMSHAEEITKIVKQYEPEINRFVIKSPACPEVQSS